jgi:hypothetical protein
MSGRRCGDLGERCKRSQRLRLDLACRPRCAWTRDPRPYMPKPRLAPSKGTRLRNMWGPILIIKGLRVERRVHI